VIPKLFHVANNRLDTIDIFDGFVDKIGLTKLESIVTIVSDLVFKLTELIEHTIKLYFCIYNTAVVLEEFSLLHILSELGDTFFKLLDILVVSFLFISNIASDFLGSVFS
jgi:hypothetical protein